MVGYDQFVVLVYWLLLAYLSAGTVFAIGFVSWGLEKIDHVAEKSGVAFRLIIFPGVVALWPWLIQRWISHAPPPTERNAHRCSGQ